jgi:DNA-binding response OmpR family regulator
VLVTIIGGQSKDEEHLARLAASGGHQLEFYRAGAAAPIAMEEPRAAIGPRALVFDAVDRPDLALGALRTLRQDPYFDGVGALLALQASPANQGELPGEFDDFAFHPYTREELQLRLRVLERRRLAPLPTRQRPLHPAPLAGIAVEEASRTLFLQGRAVQLTAREFALFLYLCEWRGVVLSREHLLAHVWGSRYSGGRRTVDIHVRRLRAKLGEALPLETLRGAGYRLRTEAEPSSGAGVANQPISAAVRLPTRSSSS